MNDSIRKHDHAYVVHETATVEAPADDEGRFLVSVGDAHHRARRAVGCLVAPDVGDRVVVATESTGPCWIVNVLSREGQGDVTLSASSGLNISSPGRVTLRGDEGVAVQSPNAVEVDAADLALRALRGRVVTEHLAVASARVSAEVAHLKGKLESLDTVAGRVTQRAKHVFREVLGIDRLRAHQVDRRAETVMRLKANHAVVDADGVVKVDGKQVQLG